MKPEFRLNVLAALLASASAWNEDVAQAYRLKGGDKFTPTDFDHLPPALKEQYVEFVDKIISDEETNAKWGHLLEDADEDTSDSQEDPEAKATLKPQSADDGQGQVSTGEVGQQEGQDQSQQQVSDKAPDGDKQEGQQAGANEGGQPQDQQQQAQGQTGEVQDPKSEAKAKKSGKGGK